MIKAPQFELHAVSLVGPKENWLIRRAFLKAQSRVWNKMELIHALARLKRFEKHLRTPVSSSFQQLKRKVLAYVLAAALMP